MIGVLRSEMVALLEAAKARLLLAGCVNGEEEMVGKAERACISSSRLETGPRYREDVFVQPQGDTCTSRAADASRLCHVSCEALLNVSSRTLTCPRHFLL